MPQHMAIEMPRHAATFPTKNVHDEHGTRLADPEQSGDGRLHVAGSPGPARGPRLSTQLGQLGLIVPNGADRTVDIDQETAHCGIEVEVGGPPSRRPKLGHDLLDRRSAHAGPSAVVSPLRSGRASSAPLPTGMPVPLFSTATTRRAASAGGPSASGFVIFLHSCAWNAQGTGFRHYPSREFWRARRQ